MVRTVENAAKASGYPTQMYIDGQWRDAASGKTLAVINPADESVVAEVAYGDASETKSAIDAAARAMPGWKALSVYDRAKILKKTADLMRDRADTIARALTQEQGKPLPEAKAEVLHAADTFEWFAEEGKRAYGRIIPPTNITKRYYTISHPVGVVGTITPWNFPAALPSRKIAPALAVGCTVVSRPADQTPLTLLLMFQCLADAGLPPGVANLVMGPPRPFADALFDHPAIRKISFTGSTEVGKELLRRSADQVKRMSLELGGHAPLIVFPDADVQQVAQAAVIGKFRNNGQVCIAPSRFYVHEKIVKDFTEAAVELARKLKLGNGLEEGVQVGPMFEARALDKAAKLIDDAKSKGASILTGGGKSSRFDKGYWFEPTVLTNVDGGMKLMTDEPFAPVMPILDFDKLDDVLAAANNTPYGLAAYVFTNDLTVATRMAEGLEAGIIGINDPIPATPQCPFGGMKESGLGRELGSEGLDAFLETKYVAVGLRQS
ncbi:MAG: NAD-dependent succinate-semialdehyde dehydrogenase [Paludisphaera borealis]|uniref:NAD-dependent succinate-semialdehyde dehydrogenase n=1 Tax=Paludisphaera borealis TaxID=1387353 RepID=UPI0028438B98|nr:NAD-dependent succinate-semialdehyde dehydrogenase [Paludisphaera borealis]MDR3622083.1 NAD-dependent succinate-semialdehyde dehydrogenase [Paludisphaera borealis]